MYYELRATDSMLDGLLQIPPVPWHDTHHTTRVMYDKSASRVLSVTTHLQPHEGVIPSSHTIDFSYVVGEIPTIADARG